MYQAQKNCGIAGTEYKDGDMIPDEAIPPGSLPSALAQGLVIKLPEPDPTPTPAEQTTKTKSK